MDERNILDHQFVVAAYTVTWVIQLGYLAWLGLKWRNEKRNAERRSQPNAQLRDLEPDGTRGPRRQAHNAGAGNAEFRRLP